MNIVIKESARTKDSRAINAAIRKARVTKDDSVITKAGLVIKKLAKTIVII